MTKALLSILLTLNMLAYQSYAQPCEITAVNATVLPCTGNNFSVSINLVVENPTSPGFTLAGNGVIYGTYLYSDLPVTVTGLLGDNESTYKFIAWDVETASCQHFTTVPAANCGPICAISNFDMQFIACQSQSGALVVFDFDYVNPSGPSFDVYKENGSPLGSWLYSSLPVTLPFYEVNGAAPIILTVCDHTNNQCCQTFTLDAIDCNPNNCEIFSVTADPQCTGNNFLVHLNFGYDNPPSDSFTVTGNGLNYGLFGYDQLPVTLGPLNGNSSIVWEFVIKDSQLPTCTATKVLGIYHCPPPCDILGLEALALECYSNEAYALQIGLDIEGEGSTGFAVFSETYYYGSYSYNSLPLILPAYAGSGEIVDIVSVCDNANLGCCATTPFEALLCAGCLIYNVTATPVPCNVLEQIYFEIDFSHQNVSLEGFEITGNGTNYGSFSYTDLPVLVGPFPGDGSVYIEFVITDLIDQLCFGAIEIGFIDCDDICVLSNLVVETGACTGNNTYLAQIDFDYQGVSGIGFDLFINGELYDSYSYNALPLTLVEFPSGGTGFDTVTVCENDNSSCCTTLIFASPDCACNIFDMVAQNLGCATDSTFNISLEFFAENMPGNLVDVFLDGVLIGSYNINNMPLTIPIHEGSGPATLTVCSNELNNCCAEVSIDLINCDGPVCQIWDLIAETGDCTSDSTYTLHVDFNSQNLSVDSVTITANGVFVGQFQVPAEFITIEHFPYFDTSHTEITVCAVGEPDCCDVYVFETADCALFGHCNIWDLVSENGDCTSDSTYILHFNFNSQNLSVDSVTLTANGIFIGQYQVSPEFITIEHFPVFDTTLTEITVCAVGEPDCCDVYVFETPDCSAFGQCHISDLVSEYADCTSDTTYILHVNFNSENLSIDSVIITGNGNYIGQYQVTGNNIIIEHFPIFETNHTVLTVCSVGEPDCCDEYEFETPNCEGGGICNLYDLVADPDTCNSDSTYVLFIHYFSINLHSDSVIVSANGEYVGHFLHQPGGFNIENFPALSTSITVVTVCSAANPDCCDEFVIETPDCGQAFDCELDDLFAEVGDCTSDSTFILDIVFQYDNLPSDSVDIYANGLYMGQYMVHPDFIRIENFPKFAEGETTITVCAVGAPDCCDTYSFDTPFCTNDCVIYNVSVDVLDCNTDSTFAVVIDFEYQNIQAGGFDVYSANGYLGFYNPNQVPIEIAHYPANGAGQYVVTICENDNTECCTSFEFEGPVCGQGGCAITNLEYALTPCDSAGNFYFILNFDFQNTGNEGFDVTGNGTNYGNFSYDDLPIQIGPFETNTLFYEFHFADTQFPDCAAALEPGVVQCLPVSTITVPIDDYFQVFNNGTTPGIFAKKDITLSLYNVNGKNIISQHSVATDEIYELRAQPNGLYIGIINYGQYTWPIKMIKSGH